MQATRTKLLVKKVYENSFTWLDLENYFNIRRDLLEHDVEAYFAKSGKGASIVVEKILSNERSIDERNTVSR